MYNYIIPTKVAITYMYTVQCSAVLLIMFYQFLTIVFLNFCIYISAVKTTNKLTKRTNKTAKFEVNFGNFKRILETFCQKFCEMLCNSEIQSFSV